MLAGAGANGESLCGAGCRPPGRTSFAASAGGPPAARWAAVTGPRAESGHPRGGAVSHRRCTRSAAATPTGPRSAIAVREGLVRGSKLVDGPSASYGWRADPAVRRAARSMPVPR
jgi:hypothetical protein